MFDAKTRLHCGFIRGIECAKPSDSTPPRNRDLYSGRVSERGGGGGKRFFRGRTTYCDRISSSSGLSVASLFPFHREKIKSYTRGEGGSYDVDLLKEERFFLFSCLFSCFKIMRGILRERDEIVIERKKMRGFIDT